MKGNLSSNALIIGAALALGGVALVGTLDIIFGCESFFGE